MIQPQTVRILPVVEVMDKTGTRRIVAVESAILCADPKAGPRVFIEGPDGIAAQRIGITGQVMEMKEFLTPWMIDTDAPLPGPNPY
jgi:hypothetical protein